MTDKTKPYGIYHQQLSKTDVMKLKVIRKITIQSTLSTRIHLLNQFESSLQTKQLGNRTVT
jgi:hypothetical protein